MQSRVSARSILSLALSAALLLPVFAFSTHFAQAAKPNNTSEIELAPIKANVGAGSLRAVLDNAGNIKLFKVCSTKVLKSCEQYTISDVQEGVSYNGLFMKGTIDAANGGTIATTIDSKRSFTMDLRKNKQYADGQFGWGLFSEDHQEVKAIKLKLKVVSMIPPKAIVIKAELVL